MAADYARRLLRCERLNTGNAGNTGTAIGTAAGLRLRPSIYRQLGSMTTEPRTCLSENLTLDGTAITDTRRHITEAASPMSSCLMVIRDAAELEVTATSAR